MGGYSRVRASVRGRFSDPGPVPFRTGIGERDRTGIGASFRRCGSDWVRGTRNLCVRVLSRQPASQELRSEGASQRASEELRKARARARWWLWRLWRRQGGGLRVRACGSYATRAPAPGRGAQPAEQAASACARTEPRQGRGQATGGASRRGGRGNPPPAMRQDSESLRLRARSESERSRSGVGVLTPTPTPREVGAASDSTGRAATGLLSRLRRSARWRARRQPHAMMARASTVLNRGAWRLVVRGLVDGIRVIQGGPPQVGGRGVHNLHNNP